ncbi:MAG: hypothetical protein KatS3mg027_2341 [Bacteroidia bacterium]|nr:MAG: hypothetical protein KatS3mg027_2341 [Bacteroidia bacterium]
MRISDELREEIKKLFNDYHNKSQLNSIDDFCDLLNKINEKIYSRNKKIKLNTITYYTNPKISENRYHTFSIRKKSGKERIIHAPHKSLSFVLRTVNILLNSVFTPHNAATGFVPKKSIRDNALKHIGHYYVYNIDIEDFFHSFDRNKVKLALMYNPFNLNEKLAFQIASLCTHPIEINGKIHYVLPQGSPTSPTFTNILCYRLDRRLNGLAKRFGVKYSRYADDITFSSFHNIYKDETFLKELERILKDEGLKINKEKTRLLKNNYRQTVTGLVVNEKPNVPRRFIKEIRMWLYYWEKYGQVKAQEILNKYYSSKNDKSSQQKTHKIENVLKGKLEFLKTIKGENDSTYKKLLERYKELNPQKPKDQISNNYSKTNKSSTNANTDEYPITYNPKRTVEILRELNQNEYLKYLTHDWNEDMFDYKDFMKKVKAEWDKKINRELKNQNKNLYSKIYAFIFGDKLGDPQDNSKDNSKKRFYCWGEKKLKFGWSSKELKEYCINNPKENPFDFEIPGKIREIDKLPTFGDYVQAFKCEIEFRDDSNNLYELFKKHNKKNKFNIEGLDALKGKSFYTDVQCFSYTISTIFKESFETRPDYKEIKVSITHKDDFYLLAITQLNSLCERSINDEKFKNPGGSLKKIIDIMKNLADFSLVFTSTIDNKTYRINYLVSNKNTEFHKELGKKNDYGGFTYEFKFYL